MDKLSYHFYRLQEVEHAINDREFRLHDFDIAANFNKNWVTFGSGRHADCPSRFTKYLECPTKGFKMMMPMRKVFRDDEW
jgi:hypothetical protein